MLRTIEEEDENQGVPDDIPMLEDEAEENEESDDDSEGGDNEENVEDMIMMITPKTARREIKRMEASRR